MAPLPATAVRSRIERVTLERIAIRIALRLPRFLVAAKTPSPVEAADIGGSSSMRRPSPTTAIIDPTIR